MNTSARCSVKSSYVSYEQVETARKWAESAYYAGSLLMERTLRADYNRLLQIFANQKEMEKIPSRGPRCDSTTEFTCWWCGTHTFWHSYLSRTKWACTECNEWPVYVRGKCIE